MTTIVNKYDRLKNILKGLNMTQEQLATAIDMDRSLLSIKINRINGRDFTLEEAKVIAEHLGIKVDDFF